MTDQEHPIVQYLMGSQHVPMIQLTQDGVIEAISPGLKAILGVEKDWVGSHIKDCFEDITLDQQKSPLDRTYIFKDQHNQVKLRGHHIKASPYHYMIIEDLRILESDIIEELTHMNIEMSNLSRKIVKQNRTLNHTNEQITILSNNDFLTGIYNRRYFFTRLEKEMLINESLQEGNLGLVSFDVDDFKQINDRYGHDIGDLVLKRLVDAVVRNIRKVDLFARVGGEEFSIIVQHTHLQDLIEMGEKLCTTCSELTWDIKGLTSVTISVGVTVLRQDDDVSSLIKRCDALMYRAKISGKNRVVYNDIEELTDEA